ncbi:HAD family hydrolase [Amnibacterium endophyticum]|uniref:HAD family hydrolase n=1 Tax=Amnibacterium endophyticum TaxID=2109337 RepID=A0ABW4LBH3_9MICO
MPAPTRLVVLDLDGTVLVGDEPVRAYLAALLRRAPLPGAEAVLESYLARGGSEPDAYAAVARIAERAGVPAADRQAAYAESRAALHAGAVAAHAAEGLAAALDRRPAGVVVALVTNAPVEGAAPLLERVGLAGRLDRVVGDAGKPAGMPEVLQGLLAETGVGAERLLAAGDVWANDLAAAAALGGTTVLIDRHGHAEGAPDLRGPSLAALLPALEEWWTRP